jgi:hypothetical protein
MHETFVQISKENIDEYLENHSIIVCHIRNSRLKAKRVAILELYTALIPLEGVFLVNGPFSDIKGTVCFLIKKPFINKLENILNGIGYSDAFKQIIFVQEAENTYVWKKRKFITKNILNQNRGVYDAQSSHNRPFLIMGKDGQRNLIKGYRGDGGLLGRRALPVEDARVLVNLAIPAYMDSMIDPFAGAGGIVCAARYINPDIKITTVDIDPVVAPGLAMYGDAHTISDAALVKLLEKYNAVVTEVPFADEATASLLAGFDNIFSYLEPDGRVSVMCAARQFDAVCDYLQHKGMYVYCAYIINRKGTDVAIVAATLDVCFAKKISTIVERVKSIY